MSVAAAAASAMFEQVGAAFDNYDVDQILGRCRQHQAHRLIDDHENGAQREPAAVRPHQLPRISPRRRPSDFSFRFRHGGPNSTLSLILLSRSYGGHYTPVKITRVLASSPRRITAPAVVDLRSLSQHVLHP